VARQRRLRLTKRPTEELLRTQADLTALTQHPSWATLEEEMERRVAELEKRVLAMTLGNPGPIDTERIHYYRGVIKGMRWFVAVPNSAERSLQSYLHDQGLSTSEGVGE
jgi:CHAD domain-containing protein